MVFFKSKKDRDEQEPAQVPSVKDWHWKKSRKPSEESFFSELARLELNEGGSLREEFSGSPTSFTSGHKECFTCKLPFLDLPEVYALGKRYHESCFECVNCGKVLDPKLYKEKNGKPYCEADYNNLFLHKCYACSKTIFQNELSVLNRYYHPNCFTCTKCSQPLCHHSFLERKGSPYCEDDFHALFSPKCYACMEPIKSEKSMTLALGTTFHREHFVCFECARPLAANNYIKREGQVYCEDDYHKVFSPRCAQCNEPIRHEGLNALGKKWHKDCCLRCDSCNKILRQDNYIQVNDKAYCRSDWKKYFAPRCHYCGQPVSQTLTGESVIALGRDYHPECFMCKDCNEPLDERSFYEYEHEPFCYEHYHRKTCPDCLKTREYKHKQKQRILSGSKAYSTTTRRSISPISLLIRPKSVN